MGTSTFSGPIRSGTVRTGGVAAGQNVGVPVLSQTAVIPFSAMTTAPTAQRMFVLPAGSKIVRFSVEKRVTIAGGSVSAVNATFGTAASAAAYLTSSAIGLTTAQAVRATLDAALVSPATDNIGTADVPVFGTFTALTGNPTSGSAVVTVEYIQRLPNGATSPTPYTA